MTDPYEIALTVILSLVGGMLFFGVLSFGAYNPQRFAGVGTIFATLFFALINFAFGTVSIVRFIMLFVSIPLVIAAIINIVYTIQYVNELKKNDCACSESFYRELMYILAIINACAWIILILIIIPLAIQYPDILKKTFNNKKFLKLYIKNGRPTNAL
jgi:hypothetical protein